MFDRSSFLLPDCGAGFSLSENSIRYRSGKKPNWEGRATCNGNARRILLALSETGPVNYMIICVRHKSSYQHHSWAGSGNVLPEVSLSAIIRHL